MRRRRMRMRKYIGNNVRRTKIMRMRAHDRCETGKDEEEEGGDEIIRSVVRE